jgi:uncharacterized protein (DUF697 family)
MATSAQPVAETESTEQQAKALVKRYMYWSMGFGALPAPGIDVLLIGGTQLNMLRNMSHIYHIDFHENRGKSIVSALVGSIGTPTLAFGSIGSLLKMIPIAGPIFGAVAMPATAGAVTYAIGKVFIQHFESGGTFLDLDPEKVKAYFHEQYAEGKKVVDEVVGSKKTVTVK